MRVSMLIERRVTDARKLVKSLLLSNHGSSIGIPKDLIIESTLRIYSATDRKKIEGLAKEAIEQVVSTERLIF
jgi:hypothetical protein